MNHYVKTTTDVTEAKAIITEGRVVAFPTGTSYGLAVDALQGHALQRLRNLKMRPAEKTFTVFMKDGLISRFFDITAEEENALEKYAGQPITLLLKAKQTVIHLAQDGYVGLRFIDHPLMQSLADAVQVPLTATSANVSEQPTCYDTQCILTAFPGKLSNEHIQLLEPEDNEGLLGTTYDLSLGCILDGGTLPPNRVSTIVKLDNGKIIVVRPGAWNPYIVSTH